MLTYICMYVHVLILVLQNFLLVILQLCHTLCVQKIVIWDSTHAHVHLYGRTRPHTGVTKLFVIYSTTLSYLMCTENCYLRLYPLSRTSVCAYTSSYWCYKTVYESFYNFAIPCIYRILYFRFLKCKLHRCFGRFLIFWWFFWFFGAFLQKKVEKNLPLFITFHLIYSFISVRWAVSEIKPENATLHKTSEEEEEELVFTIQPL
jgi:hypothetical protein